MPRFLQSASSLSSCPPLAEKEIAFLGRSNAGKSTLINGLLGQRLAKVSSKPGHTTLLNFYVDEARGYRLVDLPGYGYARRAQSEVEKWTPFIEEYLSGRDKLVGFVLVMDSRRDWSDDETNLLGWMRSHRDLRGFLALTKFDKLNQKERHERQKYFAKVLGELRLGLVPCFVSGVDGEGLEELRRGMGKLLTGPPGCV
jgi:GTP-binding protein